MAAGVYSVWKKWAAAYIECCAGYINFRGLIQGRGLVWSSYPQGPGTEPSWRLSRPTIYGIAVDWFKVQFKKREHADRDRLNSYVHTGHRPDKWLKPPEFLLECGPVTRARRRVNLWSSQSTGKPGSHSR